MLRALNIVLDKFEMGVVNHQVPGTSLKEKDGVPFFADPFLASFLTGAAAFFPLVGNTWSMISTMN